MDFLISDLLTSASYLSFRPPNSLPSGIFDLNFFLTVKADIRNPLRYLQDHKGSSRKRVLPYDIS